MYKLHIFYIFITSFGPIFGQGQACIQKDTSLCYINEKYPTSTFAIEKKYENKDTIYVSQVPLLADMDGDCIPEFIFQGTNSQNILIIDSRSGITKWTISTPSFNRANSGIAVADIDDDGIPEIFVEVAAYFQNPPNLNGRLICYKADGTILWVSDQKVDPNSIKAIGGTPALADFNQDGIPEIYLSNKIFNARTGVKLADGGANGIGAEIIPIYVQKPITVAAQLDEDSTDLELAAGYSVYKVVITNPNGMLGNSMIAHNIQVNNVNRDGFTTVGDINLDGRLDIIVTSPSMTNKALLYVFTLLPNGITQLIGKADISGIAFNIGEPFVGDIKSSGKPSIILTMFTKLHSFSYNGSNILQEDWNLNTTDSSGYTGLTMFDFNNDRIQEIVYRDETTLSIIDGSSFFPLKIATIDCYSPTQNEYPIIGDFDNSGKSKICVPCAFTINADLGKLIVFGAPDKLPGWAPARDIWNQYNYHVLNINDDLTVPRVQKNNATFKNGKFNNFYVQESLLDSSGFFNKPGASLTGKINSVNYNSNNDVYTVTFDIYNRADASARADSNLPVSFYNGDPANSGTLIGIYNTLKKINAGDSLLNLQYTFAASNLSDLFMVINTTRNKTGAFDPIDFIFSECDYTDNTFRTLVLPKDEKVNPCSTIDTNLCYIKEKYPLVKIAIERKIESEDGVSYHRTPLLADFDGDCFPELLIGGVDNNKLNFINPLNGKTIKKMYTDYLGDAPSPFAIADVDNDGNIEIVLATYDGIFTAQAVSGKLVCFNFDGSIKWISDQKYGRGPSYSEHGTPAFADFNQDGKTEVYIHNSIFNGQTGVLISYGGNNGIGNQTGFDPVTTNSSSIGSVSVAAQLDDDPSDLELAAGYTVYKVKIINPSGLMGNNMTPYNILVNNEFRDGLTSIADINKDGKLDIVVSSAQEDDACLYAYSMINGLPGLLAQKSFTNSIPNIGPALIGDINGTGRLSIIVDRQDNLFSFNYNGSLTLGQEWSIKVIDKSGDSQLTLFDLNNDEKNEIIYRDEGFLRIINVVSSIPQELIKVYCPAPSRHEGPIIGDLDNSGHAKICVSCFNKDSTFMKLYIFGPPDSLPGWAPARGIWN